MNTFVKSAVTALGLVFAAGLISCEQENMLAPIDAQLKPSGPDYPEPGPINPIPSAGTKLVTYGDWRLSYDGKGKLAQVQSIAYPTLRREYNVGAANGTGVIITDYEGTKVQRKTLIVLDEKGRCAESWNNHYGIQDGKPTSAVTHYKYMYDAGGRLEKITDQDDPSRYDKLTSNANGLVTIAHHQGGSKTSLITFSFSANGSLLPDHNHLNIAAWPLSDQVDEFLPIYGKANAYLPVEYSYYDAASKVITDRVEYKYDVNYKGFVLKRENTRYTNHQILNDTYLFEYK